MRETFPTSVGRKMYSAKSKLPKKTTATARTSSNHLGHSSCPPPVVRSSQNFLRANVSSPLHRNRAAVKREPRVFLFALQQGCVGREGSQRVNRQALPLPCVIHPTERSEAAGKTRCSDNIAPRSFLALSQSCCFQVHL